MTRPPNGRRLAPRAARRGFSLLEVMIGMTLLAIALSSVAALDYNVMRRTLQVSRASYANATLLRQQSRFLALPYDSLNAHAGCITVSAPPVPNSVCATVTAAGTGLKRVTIIVTLTGTTAHPDTVIINRSNSGGTNPLNTGP